MIAPAPNSCDEQPIPEDETYGRPPVQSVQYRKMCGRRSRTRNLLYPTR